MSDEDLVRALVRDLQPARPMWRAGSQLATFVLWSAAVVTAAVAVTAGVPLPPPALPAIVSLIVLVAAGTGAIVSSIPGRSSWGVAMTIAVAGLCVWIVYLGARAWPIPAAAAWGAVPWQKCLLFTIGVGSVAAAGLAPALRRGWPVRPRVTLALSLMAAAAAGALATTLECPSNAPLHVLAGHVVPVVLLAGLGAIAAPCTLGRRRSLRGEIDRV